MKRPWDGELEESLARLRARRPRHLLFLCVGNSARSQMAEGIARALAPKDLVISSAGAIPSHVHALAIRAMEEVGIDIRSQWSKGVDEIDLESVDAVVTLCAEQVCPTSGTGPLREHWPLPDPGFAADPLEAFRAVREELHRRISALFRDETE
jgi:arsenate reductase